MRLSDIKDEQALDTLAEIIEPLGEILEDTEVTTPFKDGKKIKAISVALKKHKTAVITIMAALDGKTPETYHFNIITIPAKMLEILNDPELLQAFRLQPQSEDVTSSGAATETIQETEIN